MMNQTLQLLDQIMEMAVEQEKELKSCYMAMHKATRTVGEFAVVHYLKVLRELIEKESAQVPSTLTLANKTFDVSFGVAPWTGDPSKHPGIPCIVAQPYGGFHYGEMDAPNADKLPAELNVGKLAEVVEEGHTWKGRRGIITRHYINRDHCSGMWGREMYTFKDITDGETYSTTAKSCEIVCLL